MEGKAPYTDFRVDACGANKSTLPAPAVEKTRSRARVQRIVAVAVGG